MFCAHCGTPCREDEVFCAHCGAALQAEGGRVEAGPSTAPAPAVETPVETPVPAARERRFSLRLPRLSRRNRLLLGGGCVVLVLLLAALTALDRPSEGFQARPATLLSIQGENETGSQYFYYDGALVAGPEENVMGLSLFLDGESCLAMDTDGYLNGVITADGLIPLHLPDGSITDYAPAADGSFLYCAMEDGTLWRCPLPDGTPEQLAEGSSVTGISVSPSGDAAVYFDHNTEGWYLVKDGTAPETLPLPEDAAVLSVSDGGRYVYYTRNSFINTNGYTSTLELDGFLYCWDGSASYLVGYAESFNTLTNRTGDQLLLMGSSGTYLVEGTENRFWPGAFFPLWLLQRSGSSGTYTGSGITVVNCADLTRGFFVSSEYQALCRMEGDALTPVLEETELFYLGADAAGEVLWYIQDGDLWQFRDGRSTLQWEDIGGEASLGGASPDGDTIVVYQSGNGLCRLTADGKPEPLGDGHYPYTFWNGFYFEDGDQLYYAPWDGTPEVVEELDRVQGIRCIGTSPLRVELRDGSVWHVIDGRDPIRITPPASS